MASTTNHYLRAVETALTAIPHDQSLSSPPRRSNIVGRQSRYLEPLRVIRQNVSLSRVISARRLSDSSPLQPSANEEDLQKDIEIALSCMPVEATSPKRSVITILSEEITRMEEESTHAEVEPMAENENESFESLEESP